MQKILKNNNFISLIFILIPLFSFANVNFHSFDTIFLNSVFFISLISIATIFSLSKFLSLFFKKFNFETINLVFSFSFFILFYLFGVFKTSLVSINPIYNAEISFVLSLIFLSLFLVFFLNKKYIFFQRFILIYISIIFIIDLSTFISNTKIFLSKKTLNDQLVLVDEEGLEYLKNNKKTNMYFVIVDGAISLDKFDEHYKTNYFSSYIPEFKKLGFNYIKNTKSAYPNTAHNMTAFYNLDYHIDEKNYQNYPIGEVWPKIIEKRNISKLALIQNLKKINYKLKWVGNTYHDCKYNYDLCLDEDNKKNKKYFIAPYVLEAFLQRSPLITVYVKSKSILGLSVPIRQYQKENDALNVFMSKNENFKYKNQGYLFLIHSLLPHWPYTFNSDCSIKKGLEILDLKKIQLDGKTRSDNVEEAKLYRAHYECMLKRVDEFTHFIDKNDPDANVVIISDHGHNIKDHFILGYDTFALIRKNKKCEHDVSDNLNTANAARLILGCTVGTKFNLLEKRAYYVYFKRGNANIGGNLGLERVDPDDYSEIFERFPFAPEH